MYYWERVRPIRVDGLDATLWRCYLDKAGYAYVKERRYAATLDRGGYQIPPKSPLLSPHTQKAAIEQLRHRLANWREWARGRAHRRGGRKLKEEGTPEEQKARRLNRERVAAWRRKQEEQLNRRLAELYPDPPRTHKRKTDKSKQE